MGAPRFNNSGGYGPAEKCLHVKTYAVGDLANGSTVRVEFGNIPRTDGKGRKGHLVGFVLNGTLQYDVVAATLGAAIAGERLFDDLYRNITMRALGQDLFKGTIHGLRLIKDQVMREGNILHVVPDDGSGNGIADADATNATITVRIAYRFGTTRNGDELDGAIPLSALDHREDANDCLSFVVGSDFAQGAGISGATWDGMTALQAFALVVYDDKDVIAPFPVLTEEVTTQTQGVVEALDQSALCDYVVIHHDAEDANSGSVADYSAITIHHGSDLYAAALSNAALGGMAESTRESAYRTSDTVIGTSTNTAGSSQDPAFFRPATDWIGLMLSRPGSRADKLGRCPVSWEATRATNTNTRLLHRQRREWRPRELECIAKRWKVDPAALPRQVVGNVPIARLTVAPGLIPQKVDLI